MKYQPKHLRGEKSSARVDQPEDDRLTNGADSGDAPLDGSTGTPLKRDNELPDPVHPLGIPIPDPGDGGEYVPIPGKGSIDHIAPNGAVIRNPWSEQPEIKPDHAYTDEQQDQNLLIM